jgi:hypothetical protein
LRARWARSSATSWTIVVETGRVRARSSAPTRRLDGYTLLLADNATLAVN